jgi:hypothetical protein
VLLEKTCPNLVHLDAEHPVRRSVKLVQSLAECRREGAYGKAPPSVHLRKELDASALAPYNEYCQASGLVLHETCLRVPLKNSRRVTMYGLDQKGARTVSQSASTASN